MRKSELAAIRAAKFEDLNVLFKMFDIPAYAYYNEGKPNNGAGCWRPYPFRIDSIEKISDSTGQRPGSLREKMTTIHMCASLAELEAKAHKMIGKSQT